jgi:DNA-binding IclR family transcriptional regulator
MAPANLGLRNGSSSFETVTGQTRSIQDLRAELAEINARGYAYSSFESTREAWSVAAPILVSDSVAGVLTTIVPATRKDLDYVDEITRHTLAAARAIA